MSGLNVGGGSPSAATLSDALKALTNPEALKASIAKLKAAEDAANEAARRADDAKVNLAAHERDIRAKNDDLQKRIAEHEQKARTIDIQQAQQSLTLGNRDRGLALAQQNLETRETKLRNDMADLQRITAENERAFEVRAAQLAEREAVVSQREQTIAKIRHAVATALGG